VLPDIINTVLLAAVLSATNSSVYSSSRILIALGNEGHAPKMFLHKNGQGIPYYADALTTAFGLLAFLNLSDEGGNVFNRLVNITGVAGLITRACINLCHQRFMAALRAQNMPQVDVATAPGFPLSSGGSVGVPLVAPLSAVLVRRQCPGPSCSADPAAAAAADQKVWGCGLGGGQWLASEDAISSCGPR
jgi:L-asparagine transporter-like permease